MSYSNEQFILKVNSKEKQVRVSLVSQARQNPAEFIAKACLALLLIPVFYLTKFRYYLQVVKQRWLNKSDKLKVPSADRTKLLIIKSQSMYIDIKSYEWLSRLPLYKHKQDQE